MKKFSVIALALVAAMLFAVPAMALDVEFSGHYRVRGFYTQNMHMNFCLRIIGALIWAHNNMIVGN